MTEKEYMELAAKSYAKIGYEAYGESTGNKNYQGLQMPAWKDLPEKIQAAWSAAAVAILSAKAKDYDLD